MQSTGRQVVGFPTKEEGRGPSALSFACFPQQKWLAGLGTN